jgi:uncharacterized membrane protein
MPRDLHPIHAIVLAGTIPLFLGAFLSDWAYALSFEPQWKNFASWLIAGGLTFGLIALIWSLFTLRRARLRGARSSWHVLLLLAAWALAFFNALVHARDAWASMPAGLVLSALVILLAIAATTMGFSRDREELPR